GDAHLRLLRCRLPFVRLVLEEAGGDRRLAPDGLVERAVDGDRPRALHGLQMTLAARGLVVDLGGGLFGQKCQPDEQTATEPAETDGFRKHGDAELYRT